MVNRTRRYNRYMKKNKTKKNHTLKIKGGGNKPEKIKKIIRIFQQYPDIFQGGIFDFYQQRFKNIWTTKPFNIKMELF